MQESGEMYLETILILGAGGTPVRSIDVAEKMCFSRPSVSKAMTRLKADACIRIDEGGLITLTDKGLEIAEKIYERHRVLSELLIRLGVDEETALRDACKMEHDISDASFIAIKRSMENRKELS